MYKQKVYKAKVIVLFLFFFSLPFEYWDPLGIRDVFTITKFVGLVYFVFSLIEGRINFRINLVKQPLFTLLALWMLMFILSAFNDRYGGKSSVYNISFLQNIFLFWLVSNDLIRNNRLLKMIFLSFIGGVLLLGILSTLGIGIEKEMGQEIGAFRLRIFGANPNFIGDLAATSLVFIFSILFNTQKFFGKKSYFLILVIPTTIMILTLSGSRGAILAALAGIVILLIFQKRSFGKKLLLILTSGGIIIYGVSKIMQTKIIQQRLQNSAEGDGLGGRTEIWNTALKIFYESPLFGKGTTGYEHEMIVNYGSYMNTHNLFLYFMVTTGIVGLFLYLKFVFHLYESARRKYDTEKNIILFAILFVYLLSVTRSGYALDSKLYWLLAAIIFSLGKTARLFEKK